MLLTTICLLANVEPVKNSGLKQDSNRIQTHGLVIDCDTKATRMLSK